jgi:uncharacterized SAM-binding protein YcdF (DUF218 family)
LILTSRLLNTQTIQRRGRCLFPVIILALLVCGSALLYLKRSALQAWPGTFLMKTDPLIKADVLIVLAGGSTGDRILEAGRLVQAGYAPIALVSGPQGWYESNECEAAIPMAVRHGYPRSSFECVPNHAHSTLDEAPPLLQAARERSAHTVLVVTSDFHTRRARGIYRRLANGLDIRMIAAPAQFYRIDQWYRHREARKLIAIEWMKTLTAPFGL